MEEKMFSLVYSVFLGVMIVLFVGFGISAFYPAPEYPKEIAVPAVGAEDSDAIARKEAAYTKQYDAYDKQAKTYNRNVSVITLLSAVVLLAIGVFIGIKNRIIVNGVVLGGLLTLIYSIIRSLMAEDPQYTFVAASVGLLLVLYLGHRYFTKVTMATKPKHKKRPTS